MMRRRPPVGGIAALTSALLHLAAAAAIIASSGASKPPTLAPTAIPVSLVLEASQIPSAAAPSPSESPKLVAASMPSLPPTPPMPPRPTPQAPDATAVPKAAAGLQALAATNSAPPAPTSPLPVPEPRRKPGVELHTATIAKPRPAAPAPPPVPVAKTPAEPMPVSAAPATPAAATKTTIAAAPTALADSFNRFVAAALGPNNPKPAYPLLARRRGLQGRVVVRAEVLPDGQSGKISILSSSGSSLLDHAAEDAVRHWRFVPAHTGDEPVPAELDVPVVFRLSD